MDSIITQIKELPLGTKGYVVGYQWSFSGYMGKLISMGLIPGVEFKLITRPSTLNPGEIEVRGIKMRIDKPEADALCIEVADSEYELAFLN
jgi:ferrous iron transport protein A